MQSAKSAAGAVVEPVPVKKPEPPTAKPVEKPATVEAPSDKNLSESKPAELPQKNPAPSETAPAAAENHETAAPPDSEAPGTDNFTARLIPKGSELRTWIGMRMWSIAGSSSAAAQLPPWIINSAGGSVYRKFSDTIDWSYHRLPIERKAEA